MTGTDRERVRRGDTATVAAVQPPFARLLDAVTSLPAWAAVLTIFVAGRLLSTFWLAAVYPLIGTAQPSNAIRGNDHGFLTFLTSWDGQYYQDISLHGYPSVLPVDSAGHVLQNAWAFLPAFPFTIRALTASTGITFEVGAPLIATIAGLVAAYLLFVLVRTRAGATAAMWGVFFFCVGPLSFLLQVGYAESMFLALTFGALVAMQRQRYLVMTALTVVAAFTRPGALAIPLTLAAIALVRYVQLRRSRRAGSDVAADDVRSGVARDATRTGLLRALPTSFPIWERVVVVVSGVVMTLAGVAWPLIAAHATGRPDAYLETEMSWWVAFIGRVDFVPLTPWFLNAGRWLGLGGVAIVILLVAGYSVWLCRRSTRKLGLVPLTFSAAYALYVFAVSIPMASTPRLLMPLAPLMASPELVARPWSRWVMVSLALAGQPVLIVVLWLLGPP
ncbi:mannosyltransferase family protein [Curtobacterium sp. Leaf261]|uniref:mannosyltransferase family protein n=1 Tax=Curtobacterium sp. Leaf261 TaxID=1736311 RepID=UPI00070091DB|nr:mannosyltransferase family protein [Curtobacterium sp. Leaf261]KQO62418.1 hypothetical protein ASF23_11650 [Curtobacterium sp. Leaf261]